MNQPVETDILEMLATASAEELWQASEAVVDAALHRRMVVGLPPISTEERLEMVQEIFEDPARVAALFLGTGVLH